MVRVVIKIDQDACNGCGLCVNACHEGAIMIVDGKAKLLRDDYCDGLGNCLPACPMQAITLEEREAAEFDESAVNNAAKVAKPSEVGASGNAAAGGAASAAAGVAASVSAGSGDAAGANAGKAPYQWPYQIKLVSANASFLQDSNLLIAADCAAYACKDFHTSFMHGRVTLIGCPKLDNVDYARKLTEILRHNRINSVTVASMAVPCCNGIRQAVIEALVNTDASIAFNMVTVGTDGAIIL
ncbi:MAG: 4Fe-4S binding protein [Coriobacteriia bacterium]|nr:4Fe-4S binding protein [Coriobacteriia bacterium]